MYLCARACVRAYRLSVRLRAWKDSRVARTSARAQAKSSRWAAQWAVPAHELVGLEGEGGAIAPVQQPVEVNLCYVTLLEHPRAREYPTVPSRCLEYATAQ